MIIHAYSYQAVTRAQYSKDCPYNLNHIDETYAAISPFICRAF